MGLTPTASCFFVYLFVVWSSSNCMGALLGRAGSRCSLRVGSMQPVLRARLPIALAADNHALCPSIAASLFRLFGFAGKTMVIANSTAMLTLLLM